MTSLSAVGYAQTWKVITVSKLQLTMSDYIEECGPPSHDTRCLAPPKPQKLQELQTPPVPSLVSRVSVVVVRMWGEDA